jgi:hypothetical protein
MEYVLMVLLYILVGNSFLVGAQMTQDDRLKREQRFAKPEQQQEVVAPKLLLTRP